MKAIRVALLVGIQAVGIAIGASEPIDAPRPVTSFSGGSSIAEPQSRNVGLASRASAPRNAAFGSAFSPNSGPTAMIATSVAIPAKPVQDYDLVILSRHRPLLISMRILQAISLDTRWNAALRKAFNYYDRDGDGFLNAFELQFILSDRGLIELMQKGYYSPDPDDPPTVQSLDRDHDGRISFAEFGGYYQKSAGELVRNLPFLADTFGNIEATEALFKLFDLNGDGKLTRSEVESAEKLIATLDQDEDECLSLVELLAHIKLADLGMGETKALPRNPEKLGIMFVYEHGRIPEAITRQILEKYDRDADLELSRIESGFDMPLFRKLDRDGNGRLTLAELDEWRNDSGDLELTLTLGHAHADCRVEVRTSADVAKERGFSWSQIESGRMVIHHEQQTIEMGIRPLSLETANTTPPDQLVRLFAEAAKGKGFVKEADLQGANALQFQLLRVLLETADRDGDAKLTREELDRHIDFQKSFVDLSIAITPAIRMPTLFQLLDENRDGKLGVRELRTAWNRLIVLEPPGPNGTLAKEVTTSVLHPIASIGLSRATEGGFASELNANDTNQVVVPSRGPIWFRKMDRNGDGDVSRAEFIGTKLEFDAIDENRDGLISLAEAEAFDKSKRK